MYRLTKLTRSAQQLLLWRGCMMKPVTKLVHASKNMRSGSCFFSLMRQAMRHMSC